MFCHNLHTDEPDLQVSLSIGLASWRPDFHDAAMWLNEADKALYIAKNTGRNKISIATVDTLLDSALKSPGQTHKTQAPP